jgi:BirA family biotin operon repressor/biotin-[acetyl-CoA-carboxylase] ligase
VDLARAPELVLERGCALGRPMHVLRTTTSTNDEAKRAARDGAPHGATWVADEQTAGRGRQGRVWVSPRGENLLFSVLARVACAPSALPPIALVAGLAVRDAVARAAPRADVRIKWPNDVLVGDKKIAGVLVEAMVAGARVEGVVIGVGLNVHTRAFPEELAAHATSVALVADTPPDRATLLADVLEGLDRDLVLSVGRGLGLLRARLASADALAGRRVRGDTGEEGLAEGIDDVGRLRVRRDDGSLVRWSAGEVGLVRRESETSRGGAPR